MRAWFVRVMAAALVLPLAACVEPPRASAPPGYAIGADGRAWRAPPPRSPFGGAATLSVPEVFDPPDYAARAYYPPSYHARPYYPPSYYPRAYYPPSYYPPSRHPPFLGWRDRWRDDDDDRRKPKKRRDDDRGTDSGRDDPPRPDPPRPDRPKPQRPKPPAPATLLIEPRSASEAAESRGDREAAESW